MRLIWQLGIRNLFRHRRRNFMLFLAIAVAVGGVSVMNTLIRGFQYNMVDVAIENLTGHVKVHAPGYRDDPSIAKSFLATDAFLSKIDADVVLGWAARVRLPAVIMSERQTRGVQLVGIDPQAEHISFLHDVTLDGAMLTGPEDRRVLIGRELLEELETRIGKRLVIITQGSDGKNRERGYRIVGTYDADGTSLEKIFVFTGLASLQKLLDTNAVTELSVRLTDEEHREASRMAMQTYFDDLDVQDWQQLEPMAAAIFVYADAAIYVWFVLMMSALVFGLVNTLVASVMERVRELGMVRALGMPRHLVIGQVVMESTLIMAVGLIVGLAAGYVGYLAIQDGIDLSAFADGVELAGMSTLMVPVLEWGDVVLVAGMTLLLGVIASIYPAWRAVKIEPLEALRV